MTVTSAAGALLVLGEDTDLLKRMVDGALARNPSHAFGWMWSGWIRTVSGEAELAMEHFEMSRRLDPRHHGGPFILPAWASAISGNGVSIRRRAFWKLRSTNYRTMR